MGKLINKLINNNSEIINKIELILADLRPYILSDGGDINFVSYDNNTGQVYVKLLGACVSCPISSITLKHGIEERLREQIPQIKEVIAL